MRAFCSVSCCVLRLRCSAPPCPRLLTLALKNYPSIRVSQQQTAAAAAAIQLARTAYLPRADVLAQINRATRNNIFGLAASAVDTANDLRAAEPRERHDERLGERGWFLVSWEPFDFGLRRANVRLPKRAKREQRQRWNEPDWKSRRRLPTRI